MAGNNADAAESAEGQLWRRSRSGAHACRGFHYGSLDPPADRRVHHEPRALRADMCGFAYLRFPLI